MPPPSPCFNIQGLPTHLSTYLPAYLAEGRRPQGSAAFTPPASEMPRACDAYDAADEDYVELLQREIMHLGLAAKASHSTSASNGNNPKGSPRVSLVGSGGSLVGSLVGSGGSLGGGGLSPYDLARAAAAAAASASAPGSAAPSPPSSPAIHSASASASPREPGEGSSRRTKGASKSSKGGQGKAKAGGSSRRTPPQNVNGLPGVQSVQMFYLQELEVGTKGGPKKGSKGCLRRSSKGGSSSSAGDADGTPRGGLRARRQQLQAQRRERSQAVDLPSRGRVEKDRFEDLLGMAMGHHCLKPTMISHPTPQDAATSPSTPSGSASASANTSASTTPANSTPSTPGAPPPASRETRRQVWGEPRLASAGSHPKAALESVLREEGLPSPSGAYASRRERRRGKSQESFPDPMDYYFDGDGVADGLMTSAGDRGKRAHRSAGSINGSKQTPPARGALVESRESATVDRRQLPGSKAQKDVGTSSVCGPSAEWQQSCGRGGPRKSLQSQRGQLLDVASEPPRAASHSLSGDPRNEVQGDGEGKGEGEGHWVVDPMVAHDRHHTYRGLGGHCGAGTMQISLPGDGAESAESDAPAESEVEEFRGVGPVGCGGGGEDEDSAMGYEEGGAVEYEEEEEIEYEEEEIEYEEEEIEFEDGGIEYEGHSDAASPGAENEWEAAERREMEQRVQARGHGRQEGEGERGEEVGDGEGGGGSLEGVNLEEQLHRARMSYDCGGASALLRVAIFNNLRRSSGMTDDMCPTP